MSALDAWRSALGTAPSDSVERCAWSTCYRVTWWTRV